MRTRVFAWLIGSSLALTAGVQGSAAQAGGLYVGVGLPITVVAPVAVAVTPPVLPPATVATAPVVTEAVVAPIALEYDPTVVVGPDDDCCGPGWRDHGWHGYGARGYGARGYDARGYDARGYDARGYGARGYGHPVARAAVRHGRR